MDNLFLLLFLASLVCLIVGLVKPTAFSRFIKGEITRKKIALIFGIACFAFFILFGVTTDTDKTKQTNTNKTATEKVTQPKTETKTQEETPKSEPAKIEEKVPQYQIVYELSNIRYDGGKNFYVLINSIDLASDNFKNDIKTIVKKIVAEKGNKISIKIHDKKATLDLSYKQYGDMSLGRMLNQSELDEIAIHLVADYSGNLETNIYLNTLSFFSGAFTDNAKVGKYLETIEFDATK